MTIVPVIICGGAGARLWPLSRENHPKPLIRLADGRSLVQHALARARGLPGAAAPITVTNRELFFAIEDEYREIEPVLDGFRFILEPQGRNTAAAIATACLEALAGGGDPDPTLCVLPADHVVADLPALYSAVQEAVVLAQEGHIVTFGIRPDRPETGYGYIEADGTRVLQFVEKPDVRHARQYMRSGRFLWNSGMFCFRARVMLDEMETFCPDILAGCRQCLGAAVRIEGGGVVRIELDAAGFARVPADSIDYAVLEKAPNVAVVSCDIGWNDIGSWSALGDLYEADEQGNRLVGKVETIGARNNVVHGDERLIVVLGAENLVIADTPDALLVTTRERAQDVRQVYDRLKAEGNELYRTHRTVRRPWGSYTVVQEGPGFKIRRVVVEPGARLSLQVHHRRAEHWVVVSGTARVVNGDHELTLAPDQSTYIPRDTPHRLDNPGIHSLVLIEVQTGDYLGEDDIVRLDDVYGRV